MSGESGAGRPRPLWVNNKIDFICYNIELTFGIFSAPPRPARSVPLPMRGRAGGNGFFSSYTLFFLFMLKNFLSFATTPGWARPATLLALSLGLAPAAFGQVTFAPAANYGAGNAPQSVAVGDFNGDGKPDLATANITGSNVSVLLGTGTGSFAAAVNYGAGANPFSVAVGDFNGDGKPDLATANYNGANVSVLLGTGTGSFAAAVNYGAGTNPYSVAVGDFNGDSKPDLATANFGDANVSVLLGTGTGSFAAAVNYGTSTNPAGVAVGDFNSDGHPDLATANYNSANVSVLLGTGTGSFAAAVNYGAGAIPISLAVGDFNSDGHPDLATANYGSDNVSVLLGTGTGSFGAAATYGAGAGPASVAVGDFNSDGKPDLATANFGGANVSVLLGTGTGSFGAAATSGAGTKSVSVAVGDFNADNKPDLATANYGGDNVSVLLNTTAIDLVISDTRNIPAGAYHNITIQTAGRGQLRGDITVSGALLIEDGGTLYTSTSSCYRISGAGSFTLAAGGYLAICDAQGIALSGATGTIQTTGVRSFSDDASYEYAAAEAQVTGNGLPATVRELFSYNDFDVTLSQAVAIRQLLDLQGDGNLQLNGQALTLRSDATGTALVANNGMGKVLGPTATVQRYLDPSLNPGLGYRHYSAPVSGSTVADLATAGFTPEVSQASAYNGSATPGTIPLFPTVFGYDQSRVTMTSTFTPFDRGFVVPAGLTAPLTPGRGYAVQIAGTEKVDFTGTLNSGDIDVSLSRISDNAEAGWALVGNPYPSPIDGNVLFDTDNKNAPGLDQSFYVVESTGPYAGMYRSYVAGFGNPFIAAGQGFFVRVSNSGTSGQLQFRNGQRVDNFDTQVSMHRGGAGTQPTVALTLRGATGPVDKLFVYADAQATPGFDGRYDAWKLSNSTGLNLSSRTPADQDLSIDGRPVFTAATRIALTVGVPTAGTYTISAASLTNLPAGLDAYLSDAATGQTLKLASSTSYRFSVSATQSLALLTGRFMLSFSSSTALASASGVDAGQVSVYPNPASGRFTVHLPAIAGARTVEATLLNSLGQVVRRQSVSASADGTHFDVVADGLSAGVYALRLTAGAVSLTKRVVLQ